MSIHEALAARGYQVIPGAHVWKSTCPHCSDFRKKRWKRETSIRVVAQDRATVYCYHCDNAEEIEA